MEEQIIVTQHRGGRDGVCGMAKEVGVSRHTVHTIKRNDLASSHAC